MNSARTFRMKFLMGSMSIAAVLLFSTISSSSYGASFSPSDWGARLINTPSTQTVPAFPGNRAFWAGACDISSSSTAVNAVAPPASPKDCIDAGIWDLSTSQDTGWSTPPGWRLSAITQAGAHPEGTATFTFERNPAGDSAPLGNTKDVSVDLPRGVVGNPSAVPKCSLEDFGASPVQCPPQSQVGVSTLRLLTGQGFFVRENDTYPVYNLEPRRGYIAEFGLTDVAWDGSRIGTGVRIWARARTEGDLGISSGIYQIPTAYPLSQQTLTFWGVPWASSHDLWRMPKGATMGNIGCDAPVGLESGFTQVSYVMPLTGLKPSCQVHYEPSWGSIKPFFNLQTSCTGSTTTRLAIDSYQYPARWLNPEERLAFRIPDLSDPNWFIYGSESPPVTGCDELEWDPSLALDPVSQQADTPTAFDVTLATPQHNEAPGALATDPSDSTGAPAFFRSKAGLATSHLKDTVVTLAEGLTFNASAANGSPGNFLDGCSPEEVGLTSALGATPITFNNADVTCPDPSKIGTVEVKAPLLDKPIPGVIYLADQDLNPFKSTFAIYLVLQDIERNLIIKIAGSVEPDPKTGQITSKFLDNPQLPFETFTLHFKGGSRATLSSPPVCGTPSSEADLTGWSDPGTPAHIEDPFEVTSSPDGGPCATDPAARPFKLGFTAGAESAAAGVHTPFGLQVTRADGNQEIDTLEISPPAGLAASLKGVPYCSEAQIRAATDRKVGKDELADPSCPAASKVGSATVGAGAGSTPLYTPGKLYLAGPYKGAPLSVVAVTPAVAGPFDFGNVVVRTALFIDRTSARVRAKTDPIPQVFAGIPLRIRDIRIKLDRRDFTLNPTDCDAMTADVVATGASGATTKVSSPFRVDGCKALGFAPKLSAKVIGGTKRGAHPAFEANLTYPQGSYANIKDVQVALPHSEFLDQAHINTICTRVQAAANACPAGAIYGYAEATTPLLDGKLTGPVFLKSSVHKLPDLAIFLKGPDAQPIEVEFQGRIDSVKGQIRNTIEGLPDVPVSSFRLYMKGGGKGLLINSRDLCKGKPGRLTVKMAGQNNKTSESRPALGNSCKKVRKTEHSRKRRDK